MQKDRLEEKLRTSLGEYPSPMDLEGAWSQLERTRNKKKRRGLWLWWIGGAALVVGALGIALIGPLGNQQPVTISTLSQKTEELGSASIKASEQVAKVTLGTQNTATKMLADEDASPADQKRSVEVTGETKQPKLAQSKSKLAGGTTSTEQSTLNSTTGKYSASIEENRRTGTNSLKASDRQRYTFLPSSKISPSINLAQQQFDALPLAGRNYRRKRRQQGGFWIGFSTSVGIQDRQLNPTQSASEDTKTLVSKRNESETSLESYSFGFDLRKDFTSNWYLQTGLRHQIGFEHFEDQYERTFTKVLDDQVTEIIQRADGSITELRGTVNVPVTESVQHSIYNTQNLTEIPILLGYQQALTDRVGVDLNVGILYGLIQRKEGQIYSLATEPGQYQSLSQLPYRRSNLWGGQLQGTVSYLMGEQWVVFGGIQAKSYANLVQSGEEFLERQLILNAVLGIRLRLQ